MPIYHPGNRGTGRIKRNGYLNPAVRPLGFKSGKLPPVPAEVDRTAMVAGVPWGMLLNGSDDDPTLPVLGDCTIAGLYHGRQITNLMAGNAPVEQPWQAVLQSYEEGAGYVLGNSATDNGALMNQVLPWHHATGIVVPEGRSKNQSFFVIDHMCEPLVKHIIDVCGFVYIGCDLPVSVYQQDLPYFDAPLGAQIESGHCIIAWGYRPNGLYKIVTWGNGDLYMSPKFLQNYVTETYAVVDFELAAATGKTPLGISLTDLAAAIAPYQVNYVR